MTSTEIRDKIAELNRWLDAEDELVRKLDSLDEPVTEDVCIEFYKPLDEVTYSGCAAKRFVFFLRTQHL